MRRCPTIRRGDGAARDLAPVAQRLELDWADGTPGAAERVGPPLAGPTDIAGLTSQSDDGPYLTVLHCHGSVTSVDFAFDVAAEACSSSPMFTSNVGEKVVVLLTPPSCTTAWVTLRGTDGEVVHEQRLTFGHRPRKTPPG
jgi:hypothetical protein